ncbi:MAG: NAD-dependent epimerase/dehydratase family protein, partial [bacterium]
AYLIHTLLRLNDILNLNLKVTGLARNESKAKDKYSSYLKRNDFNLIIQDVCDPVRCTEKIDFIIHAASQASPKFYGTDPVGTLNANVLGTNNLLHLAKKNNVESFLFFSTSEVYGAVSEAQIPTKENEYGYLDPVNVRSCYGESKRLGETMCVSWLHQHNIPVKIVRPFHTYGPGMDLNDGRVYADFISDVVNNRDIEMKSDGQATRAFCYISDATAAFFLILLNGKNGEAYNAGNPFQEISIIRLAEKLVGLFPEKKLKVISMKQTGDGYLRSTVSRNSPDISKIGQLGWKPVTTIEEGFRKTIMSYE